MAMPDVMSADVFHALMPDYLRRLLPPLLPSSCRAAPFSSMMLSRHAVTIFAFHIPAAACHADADARPVAAVLSPTY